MATHTMQARSKNNNSISVTITYNGGLGNKYGSYGYVIESELMGYHRSGQIESFDNFVDTLKAEVLLAEAEWTRRCDRDFDAYNLIQSIVDSCDWIELVPCWPAPMAAYDGAED